MNPQLHIQLTLINKKKATLKIENNTVQLLRPRTLSARSTGLLNHISLAPNEGLLFTRTWLLHTFGMEFPIVVLPFDKKLQPIFPPRIVEPGAFVAIPFSARFVAELSSHSEITPWAKKKGPSPFWLNSIAKILGITP
jgi:hypothetical protein